jgi:hypothetical protein
MLQSRYLLCFCTVNKYTLYCIDTILAGVDTCTCSALVVPAHGKVTAIARGLKASSLMKGSKTDKNTKEGTYALGHNGSNGWVSHT